MAGVHPDVVTLRGEIFSPAGEALDDLLIAVDAPIPARRPWLDAWAASYSDRTAWLLGIGNLGRLEAAAVLAVSRRAGVHRICSLGAGQSDHVLLPARTQTAAEQLAEALAEALRSLRGPWYLDLEQLPHRDPVAARLLQVLPAAISVPGAPLPYLTIPERLPAGKYAPKKFRQQTRAAQRRFDAAGVTTVQRSVQDPGEIRRLLPQVRQVRLARDHALGRVSDLDDEALTRFWERAALALAERGELEATTLHADGDLAAYCLGMRDGSTYRLWDGRINPVWAPQWPGQLLYGQLLERLVVDGTCRQIDFMRGSTAFKHRLTQTALQRDHLQAASSMAVLAAVLAPGRARSAARALKQRSPALSEAWAVVKRRRIRGLPHEEPSPP
jgi:CelD/BcsL family acetyltransferase involved in cellulose biosynthesis